MGGGILLLSLMTFFLDLRVIVPVHGLVQLASNSTRSLSLRREVEPRILIPATLGLVLGTFVATQIIQNIPQREYFYFLIAALILYVLFKPKKLPTLMLPYWSFGILGFVMGVLNPIIGASGPLLAPFLLRDDLRKEQIVGTKAAIQTIGHLLKVPAFLYLGFNYVDHWLLTLCMIVAVILGTKSGIFILHRIQERTFRWIFSIALFVAASRLIYKAILSLA